ncbi:transglycosylase family protein [Streptomyces sp. NPDC020681]|uniref:transglycosylase family protein n=1 Tax=Streptomyces sp. NPDC020681 TaxID=3365083 RepID=UPI0037A76357
MLSGNGRHRRPRQAPAIVVAAGVTGSAIAIPLLGAGSASAADAATWDRVAECESGGAWSADTGNGYYGGLQFSQEAWEDFGGTAYADRADLASRSQQIAIAEKVLDVQGPEAWATCSALAGLRNDGADTGVDPGVSIPPSASPSAPAESADPEASDTSDASDASKPADSTKAGDATGKPAEPATGGEAADSAGGKHRGEPAPEDSETAESGNADNERESGRHASRSDDSAREDAGNSDNADGSSEAAAGEYTVQPGDTLWGIVKEQKLTGGWKPLYEANQETVGADPDLILPGQSLDLGLK